LGVVLVGVGLVVVIDLINCWVCELTPSMVMD
jgi:hypothetical protein